MTSYLFIMLYVLRFNGYLRNRARGTCEGALTVWHATTICKSVKVVSHGHLAMIFKCKPRKQFSYASVLQMIYKHKPGAI